MKCIVISGISGSGKTTIGKLLAVKLKGVFIDGDSFYLNKKPMVELSPGQNVSNWDHPDAIDWEKLNNTVKEQLRTKNVVLATFLPIIDRFEFKVTLHIRLITDYEEDAIIEKSIIARRAAKNLRNPKRDELMVRKVVYPMYVKMLEDTNVVEIEVYDHLDNRKTKEEILNDA